MKVCFFNFYFLIMFFLSRITDLVLVFLILIGKEILFAGEERLIVISYFVLFILLFFLLSNLLSSDFHYRSNVIKEEIESFFISIISILSATKQLLLNSNFIYIRLLKLYRSLVLEYYYNIYFNFNFSHFKMLFLNYKISQMLVSSLSFILKLNFAFNKYYLLSLYKYNIAWESAHSVTWNRISCDLSGADSMLFSSENSIENSRKFLEKQRPWFITMEEWFSLNSDFKYKYLFEFKDFKYSIYNSYK